VFIAAMTVMASPAFAEVSDKLPGIGHHWLVCAPLALLAFFAARWRLWAGLIVAVVVSIVLWADVDLVSDASMRTALLAENGGMYFVSLGLSDAMVILSLGAGFWLNRGRASGQPLAR
jgi:hypothetical protein